MSWVFGALGVAMGIVFLWGLVAPRSQWRALSSWSVADPHAHEPGGAAYTARRLLSGAGMLGMAVVALLASPSLLVSPQRVPSPTAVQLMWGIPAPQLVDRVFNSFTTPPEGLVAEPTLDYQAFGEEDALPPYLLTLRAFSLLGNDDVPGYLGSVANEGESALGSADLVAHVRGPVLCMPREVLVIETETTVQIAVYFGLPDSLDPATILDHVTGCPVDDPVTSSMLVPIDLSAPLGDRIVLGLDGTELEAVPLVE